MRENRLRTMWKAGEAAVNGWLAIPNSFSAETMRRSSGASYSRSRSSMPLCEGLPTSPQSCATSSPAAA